MNCHLAEDLAQRISSDVKQQAPVLTRFQQEADRALLWRRSPRGV